MRLLLVRHGETDWNAQHRWQGHIDRPLTDRGRAQAVERARGLAEAGVRFDHLVSSDLDRALATATILGAHLGLSPTPDPAFRERHGGHFQGLDRAALERTFPTELAQWRAGNLDRPPGGESDDDVHSRVTAALATVAAADHGTVLVVTHGGVLRIVTERSGAGRVSTSNLGGRWFEWRNGSLAPAEPLVDV